MTRTNPDQTNGAERLRVVMSELDLSQRGVAKLVGCAPSTICRLLAREAKPGRPLGGKLFVEFNIPIESWDCDGAT